VKNPNKVEEVDERTSKEITEHMLQLNGEAKGLLDEIFAMV
jgi:hypothetical protein